jgi:hypothetical protein
VAGAGVILGSDTVTRLRGRSRDNFGNLQGSDSELDVTGCSVQPVSASESTDRGELTIANLTLYAPPGTDITATDRVRWQGDVYAVNGPPAVWRDETGAEDHVQAQLLLKEGQG